MDFYGPELEEIKVKVGDTLKLIKYEKYSALEMDSLREEIRDLFNIPVDADFTLTYADHFGDVITISDDHDLDKAAAQGRINVQLSNINKGVNSYAPCPNIKTRVIAEGLQSVPQQICEALKLHETLLKIPEDIVSKAATGPVLVELVDFISKMTQSYLNLDSQTTQSRADSTTQNKKNKNKNKNKKTTQNVADGTKLRMPYGFANDN
ncbi:hypothetical protein I3842_11G020500 [Carya illinoinensis]|uniref:PB1 domain-containing protein n=1 Tax=Carya illinoinensis TaxID=32201 RepID=A0A922IXB6_CARIL|nr:hypothetical protein I3842_11G020500 [Carya illinoinensis]